MSLANVPAKATVGAPAGLACQDAHQEVYVQIPDSTTPHGVAATLLGFFASLPAPFMPPAVAQVCNVCVPTHSAAASLLADSLSPVEWAVFRHVSGEGNWRCLYAFSLMCCGLKWHVPLSVL